MLTCPLFFLFLSSSTVFQLEEGLLRADPAGNVSAKLPVFLHSSVKPTVLSSPPSQQGSTASATLGTWVTWTPAPCAGSGWKSSLSWD